MASGPIITWQIEREKVEAVTDILFLGSKIITDGDCSHETRRRLLLGLSSGIWNLGVFSRRSTGESLPLRVDFIHRVEFEEVSVHRVLIKRGPGNRGASECGTTHEATSGMSS